MVQLKCLLDSLSTQFLCMFLLFSSEGLGVMLDNFGSQKQSGRNYLISFNTYKGEGKDVQKWNWNTKHYWLCHGAQSKEWKLSCLYASEKNMFNVSVLFEKFPKGETLPPGLTNSVILCLMLKFISQGKQDGWNINPATRLKFLKIFWGGFNKYIIISLTNATLKGFDVYLANILSAYL